MRGQPTDNGVNANATTGASSYISIGIIGSRSNTEAETTDPNITDIHANDVAEINESETEMSQFSEEYICSICNNLFIQATRLPCDHVYCFYCLQKSLIQKPRCPECRALAISYEPDRMIDVTIERLLVHRSDIRESRQRRASLRFKDPQLIHLTKSKKSNEESVGNIEEFAFTVPSSDIFYSTNYKREVNTEQERETSLILVRDDESSFSGSSSDTGSNELLILDTLPSYAEAVDMLKKKN